MPDVGELTLDPRIRDWVLLPLTALIIIVQLLRTILMQLMTKPTAKDADEVEQRGIVERSQRTRMASGFLSKDAVLGRQTWLLRTKGEGLRTKAEAAAMDTSSMMGPMQTQAVFYLSNIGFLTLVQTLFTGFILVKLPFSLTERFRSLTQRDMSQSLELLDPALVTSFSWYIMCLYGCQGIITLVLGGKSSEFADQSAMLMNQMGMGGGGKPQQWNPSAAFKAERAQLRIARPDPVHLVASERAIIEAFATKADVEAVAKIQADRALAARTRR